jgi:NAD(P)-dependent dehydrogenase (short-subunit alcohol dehydrogenase family)
MMKGMLDAGKLDRPKLAERTPRGRLGRQEDIAAAAALLASRDADFIVGETLVVRGGWLAYGFI